MYSEAFIVPPVSLSRFSLSSHSDIAKHHNRDMSDFSQRLREARTDAKLTQPELAERVDLAQGTISDLERGRRASTTKVAEIAVACGVNPTWLATGKGSKNPLAAQEPLRAYVVTPIDSELEELFKQLTQSQQEAQLATMRALVEGNNRLFEELSQARKGLPENRPGFRIGGAITENTTSKAGKTQKTG